MRTFGDLKQTVGRFAENKKGNFAIAAAVALPVLLAAVGVGLDTAQMYQTKSNLQNALDAAVTSTARDITTGKIDKKDARKSVEDFLLANAATGFADVENISLENLVIDKQARTMDAQASVKIKMAFPLLNLTRERKIATHSAAVYSDTKIEVAMMLDITGSMGGAKLEALKTASKSAARMFLEGQNLTDPRVRVAVVPYADAVNVGLLKDFVHPEKKDGPKAPPPVSNPPLVNDGPDRCATERKNGNGKAAAINDTDPHAVMVNRDYRLTYCPGSELRPLTADLNAVNSTVDSFTASGATAGHIGIEWVWYMLSPKWDKAVPAGSAAAAYNDKNVEKYAILMTDGQFNTAFAGVPDDEEPRGGQIGRSRTIAELTCEKMKKKGIVIYTVGFMLDSADSKEIMQRCSSGVIDGTQHYFEAANGAQLIAAFEKITANIERLAVTR